MGQTAWNPCVLLDQKVPTLGRNSIEKYTNRWENLVGQTAWNPCVVKTYPCVLLDQKVPTLGRNSIEKYTNRWENLVGQTAWNPCVLLKKNPTSSIYFL